VTDTSARKSSAPAALGARSDVGAPTIRVDNVSVHFGDPGRGTVTQALKEISFVVEPGEFVAVVGPSGCGKSTLLKAIAGLVRPSGGRVTFDGRKLSRADRLGFVFQNDALLPWKTAVQNVAVADALRDGRLRAGTSSRARDLMAQLGLGDACDKYPHQLSGGMRKRVALARTLAYEPRAFMMDEPFGALDAQTRVSVGNFFLEVLGGGQSVIFVTHDIEEAVTMADRVLVLSKGPNSAVANEFRIPIPRPRDYYESRFADHFMDYQHEIWLALGYGRGGAK
jgi:NitT/TauT family transport system ATP-binding protein